MYFYYLYDAGLIYDFSIYVNIYFIIFLFYLTKN